MGVKIYLQASVAFRDTLFSERGAERGKALKMGGVIGHHARTLLSRNKKHTA